MDIIYALVPLSILLIGIAVLVFFWAVKSGQFEDLESPAHRILFDDDDDLKPAARSDDATDSDSEPSTNSK
jgi:cbb3-type cytochrome oxidase maturation protein